MQAFSYHKARNVPEACKSLYQEGAVLVAGGTDLIPRMKNETINPKVLVDISALEELNEVDVLPEKVRFGAGAKLKDLLGHKVLSDDYPELLKAIRRVASPQIRNRATLGGNLCQYTRCQYFNQSYIWRKTIGLCYRAGGTVCHQRKNSPSCIASFYSDIAPLLVAADAKAFISGVRGQRIVPLAEIYRRDGSLALNKGELLAFVEFDRKKDHGWSFLARNLRRAIDFGIAIVAVVIGVEPEKGFCRNASIVLGAAAPYPYKAKKAEDLLIGKVLNESLNEEAAMLAAGEINPVPEPYASPKYKKQLFGVLVKRAINEAYTEALSRDVGN